MTIHLTCALNKENCKFLGLLKIKQNHVARIYAELSKKIPMENVTGVLNTALYYPAMQVMVPHLPSCGYSLVCGYTKYTSGQNARVISVLSAGRPQYNRKPIAPLNSSGIGKKRRARSSDESSDDDCSISLSSSLPARLVETRHEKQAREEQEKEMSIMHTCFYNYIINDYEV